jgi:hypothetical protein
MPVGVKVLSGVQYMPVWVNVLAGVLDSLCISACRSTVYASWSKCVCKVYLTVCAECFQLYMPGGLEVLAGACEACRCTDTPVSA